jgi:hypothetical protein
MRHTRVRSSHTPWEPWHPPRVILYILALLAASLPGPARAGQAVTPELSRAEVKEFLANAKIVKGKDAAKGVTRPVRVTLSDGNVTHDALFSSVDERKAMERFESGKVELDFVDSYKYSLAAYRIAELVGLEDMMPVHVEREWRGRKGVLAWWVDDVMMEEGDRLKKKVEVPNPQAWNEQMHRMRVFTQLVADTDRNVGNILIDKNWRVWMIDFTRAFRHNKALLSDKDLKKCDRQLLEKLRALTADQVAAATRPYLTGAEIEPLMARRDVIVKFFESLAAKNGEAQVLY